MCHLVCGLNWLHNMWLGLQVKEGNEAAHRAKRGVRQAVVKAAEVVACTLSSGGQFVLVGDPKQLPPTVLLQAAEAVNLSSSLRGSSRCAVLNKLSLP